MPRPLIAGPDGAFDTAPGIGAAARSGRRVMPVSVDDLVPLPAEATLVHLPGRAALGVDGHGAVTEVAGAAPVAAVLPVGWLRTLLPASRRLPGSARLPLFGYTAVAEHRGGVWAAALHTDRLGWWRPAEFRRADLPAAVAAARAALPGNRVVDQLAVCALEHNCYTAQNTFHRRYEGALPASPACNADCLGCISLQSDGLAPAPQPRMPFAPTAEELADLAAHHLEGADARIVSFGQGCEGEPLTRDDALAGATARIRARFPTATIHVNTNGSRPVALRRLIDAGCNSVRISAISFTDAVFRAYYRPVGYGLDDVVECGRLMAAAGGQVCLNLLTLPGLTDTPEEIERTAAACTEMGVHQVQWRSLNVDHDWLLELLPEAMGEGIGMARALQRMRAALPGVRHGNFTRPWPAPEPIAASRGGDGPPPPAWDPRPRGTLGRR